MGFYGSYESISIQKGNNTESMFQKEEYNGPSTSAKICIGICEGYNNNKEKIDDFEDWLQIRLEQLSEKLGFYISFVVYEIKTIYKKEWGCPDGGEKTYNLEATRNPVFNSDDDLWRNQVVQIIHILKEELKQSTVTLQFIPIDIVYMKTKKGEN